MLLLCEKGALHLYFIAFHFSLLWCGSLMHKLTHTRAPRFISDIWKPECNDQNIKKLEKKDCEYSSGNSYNNWIEIQREDKLKWSNFSVLNIPYSILLISVVALKCCVGKMRSFSILNSTLTKSKQTLVAHRFDVCVWYVCKQTHTYTIQMISRMIKQMKNIALIKWIYINSK